MKRFAITALLAGAFLVGLVIAPTASHAIDYDCGDFSTQEEAQSFLLPGDPHNLDGDGDGIACESLPSGGGGGGDPAPPPSDGPDETGGSPKPAPKPPELAAPAARRAIGQTARRHIRSSRLISGVRQARCARRSRHRIDCLLVAQGATATIRTRCKLIYTARGRGSRAQAKLAGKRCRSAQRRLAGRPQVPSDPEGAEP